MRSLEAGRNLQIRRMRDSDIGLVVLLHMRCFPGFFLTSLGPRFLSLLYLGMNTDSQGVVLVAHQGEATVGFVAGVADQRGFYSRLLLEKKWQFALAACGGFLRQPSIAARLLRALRRPTEAKSAISPACLMSIAVDPEAGRKGVGSGLVASFVGEMRARGVSRFCLTTDSCNNDSVNAFYRRTGFKLVRTFNTPEYREMNEYLYELGDAA